MDKTKIVTNQPLSAGDAAVSGLFNGLLAGIAMGFYLVFAGLLDGQGITGYLAYFGLGKTQSPLAGLLLHLAISGIYGVIFGAVRHWVGLDHNRILPRWMVGVVYGLFTWVLAVYLILPGIGSSLAAIPTLHFILAHLIFGLALGFLQKP